jgi:putative ABC transport system ATP-binding protein
MEDDQFSVRAVDVWKSYDGDKYVLSGINMTLQPKEIVLIRGRSGSGKTTLLNLLGCLDKPSKGDIYLNGYDTATLSRRKLADVRLYTIGIVFQSHNLLEELTVLENVLLPLKIAHRDDADERALKLLDNFDIQHLADKMPNGISGGEQQRVAIARALANEPKLLIADEPTASLDLDNSDVVLGAFKKANELFGTTVVIASHDPVVEGHVNRVLNLKKGMLEVE